MTAMMSSEVANVHHTAMAFPMPNCTEEPNTKGENSGSPVKPRRNLTHTFDAVCADREVLSPPAASEKQTIFSPSGVAELSIERDEDMGVPQIELHPDLKRELTEFVVHRVSCYSIIHDVNKEAGKLVTNDPSSPPPNTMEMSSPLVEAVVGAGETQRTPIVTEVTVAAIDEEQWLLDAIASRTPEETSHSEGPCPPTFSQAMGEKEYENPVNAVAGHARTQLWKPSRSWWEAKSGKNPWIDPPSHNKRWRYLWPLIHYHKFLAKCIKKLKRSAIDVKMSMSPVAVFLREEVCAVSDHLAAVSFFDSEKWMAALKNFSGWSVTTDDAAASYRHFVSSLKLRPYLDIGDVDSPLLRTQIEKNLLSTIALQRDLMNDISTAPTAKVQTPVGGGPPPAYPRGPANTASVPKQIHGVRRQRHYHPHPQLWWDGQSPHPLVGDGSSVQSGLSVDSLSQRQHYDYAMYHPVPGYYGVPPPNFPGSDTSHSTDAGGYPHHAYVDPHGYSQGWNSIAMGYAYPPTQMQACYPQNPYPQELAAHGMPQQSDQAGDACVTSPDDKPVESTESPHNQSHSPYWDHLDHATMAHIATPAKGSPSTPRRGEDKRDDQECPEEETKEAGFAANAQPPLLRQQPFYNVPYGHREGYVPLSPATQFMMSPQQAYHHYHYPGYGQVSPRRQGSRGTPRGKHTQLHQSSPGVTSTVSPPAVTKPGKAERESPSTVETTTESESGPEPPSTS